jgi:hypothetical protein
LGDAVKSQGGTAAAVKHVKANTRKQPGPEEPLEADPQLRIVCPAGGVLIFSAAHLHSTVPKYVRPIAVQRRFSNGAHRRSPGAKRAESRQRVDRDEPARF